MSASGEPRVLAGRLPMSTHVLGLNGADGGRVLDLSPGARFYVPGPGVVDLMPTGEDPIGIDWAPNGINWVTGRARIAGVNYYDLASVPNLTTTRSNAATVLDQTTGQFVDVAANARRRRDGTGLYVDPSLTNLMRGSPTAAQCPVKGNATDVAAPASPPYPGLNWLNIDNAAGLAYAYESIVTTGSAVMAIYALIHAPDGVAPVASANPLTGDFSFVVGGAVVPVTSIRSQRHGGTNFWLVTAWFTNAASLSSNNCGIIRYTTQNTRTLYFGARGLFAGNGLAPSGQLILGAPGTVVSADTVSLTGLSLGPAVTLFSEFSWEGGDGALSLGARVPAILDDGVSSANAAYFFNTTGAALGFQTYVAGGLQGNVTTATGGAVGVVQKIVGRSKANDFLAAKNGALATPDTSGSTPASLTRLRFLSTGALLRRTMWWDEGKDDAFLQGITT